jgi:hypothetical protein
MRHFLGKPDTICILAQGMGTVRCSLVAFTSQASGFLSGQLPAFTKAVAIATVTSAAIAHNGATKGTEVLPVTVLLQATAVQDWTSRLESGTLIVSS